MPQPRMRGAGGELAPGGWRSIGMERGRRPRGAQARPANGCRRSPEPGRGGMVVFFKPTHHRRGHRVLAVSGPGRAVAAGFPPFPARGMAPVPEHRRERVSARGQMRGGCASPLTRSPLPSSGVGWKWPLNRPSPTASPPPLWVAPEPPTASSFPRRAHRCSPRWKSS